MSNAYTHRVIATAHAIHHEMDAFLCPRDNGLACDWWDRHTPSGSHSGTSTYTDLYIDRRVRFFGDRRWWTVRAVSENFTCLTRARAFVAAGTNRSTLYTVIDWRHDVRGPCNLIGQGYGDGHYAEAECAEMLAQFESGELEVSNRNRVRLNVEDVRP